MSPGRFIVSQESLRRDGKTYDDSTNESRTTIVAWRKVTGVSTKSFLSNVIVMKEIVFMLGRIGMAVHHLLVVGLLVCHVVFCLTRDVQNYWKLSKGWTVKPGLINKVWGSGAPFIPQ